MLLVNNLTATQNFDTFCLSITSTTKMGNIQFISGNQVSDNPDKDLFGEVSSSTSKSELDSSFENTSAPNTTFIEKIVCEYCQEFTYPQFFDQHARICPYSPANLRAHLHFGLDRSKSINNLNHNSELEKKTCEFCHEQCYLKFHDHHKRICSKNPENIKVYCRNCEQTLNLIQYQNHLLSCEATTRNSRARSLEHASKDRDVYKLNRKFKTNNEIQIIKNKNNTRTLDCPICLEDIQSHSDMATLPCSHIFHERCLNNWSLRQRKCPICRKEFL